MKKDIIEYRNILSKLSNEFELISIDSKNNKKFIFKHNCGYIFSTDFSSLKNSILKYNGGCPKCAMERRKKNLSHQITKEEFQKYLEKTNQDKEYTLNRIWFDNKRKRSYVELTHEKCGRKFEKRVNDFKNGYKCTWCGLERKDSELTMKIKEYLKSHNQNYKIETSIREIQRDGKNFLLNDFNINEKIYIESDGEQHFKQKAHRDPLEIIRERDLTKDNYYFNNKKNFTYLRIPYTESKNVEKILDLLFQKQYNDLRLFRVMIVSEKTIINYENQRYYEINKNKHLNCRSKTT